MLTGPPRGLEREPWCVAASFILLIVWRGSLTCVSSAIPFFFFTSMWRVNVLRVLPVDTYFFFSLNHCLLLFLCACCVVSAHVRSLLFVLLGRVSRECHEHQRYFPFPLLLCLVFFFSFSFLFLFLKHRCESEARDCLYCSQSSCTSVCVCVCAYVLCYNGCAPPFFLFSYSSTDTALFFFCVCVC